MIAEKVFHYEPSIRRSTVFDLDIGRELSLDLLTPRELEIARLVAKGFSNKEVGQFLEISHWTVAAHLKSTFLKLGVKRRADLAYSMRKVI